MARKTKQRKPEPFKCCETRGNMQPIGEGDHICDACCSHDGSPTALILESHSPADDYFIRNGRSWTPQRARPTEAASARPTTPTQHRPTPSTPSSTASRA